MRHTVELKIPKLFGKKTDNDSEVRTEIDLMDKNKIKSAALLIGVPLTVGITVGYLVGFNRGVNKNSSIYVIK